MNSAPLNEHTPDVWVIVRFENDGDTIYKVLGGWYGGYLGSDSWRMNSGINKIKRDGDWYLIHGHSGSVYRVHPDAQKMSGLTGRVYSRIAEVPGVSIVDINDVSL